MPGHKGIAHNNLITTFRASLKEGSNTKFLSRNFCLGEKSRVAEGHEFPEWVCAEIQFGAF